MGPTMSSVPSDRFNLEVLRLLVRIAREDEEVEAHEKHLILGLGKSWNVAPADLTLLQAALDGKVPVPQADLALLRSRPDEALEAAQAMVASDGRQRPPELKLLRELKATLTAPR